MVEILLLLGVVVFIAFTGERSELRSEFSDRFQEFIDGITGRRYTSSSKSSCIGNLKQLDGAKATWALENKMSSTDVPVDSDLFGATLYIRDKPVCPGGGTYTFGSVLELVQCSISSHSLSGGDVRVMDETGAPIIGAVLQLKGAHEQPVTTDTNGLGRVNQWADGATAVLVSKIDYESKLVSLTNRWPFKVVLRQLR